MSVIAAMLVAAVTWFPADDWKDAPDPVASPRARKGGFVRFNGSQPPKSFNYYVDSNTYTRMMFSLMYETLLVTDTQTLDFAPALARRWAVSDDGSEFTFVIDERAIDICISLGVDGLEALLLGCLGVCLLPHDHPDLAVYFTFFLLKFIVQRKECLCFFVGQAGFLSKEFFLLFPVLGR